MSDEPQPLRIKPRSPPAAGAPPAPDAPPKPAPSSAAGADQGDSPGRLRLKARLNLPAETPEQATPDPTLVPPPPPPTGAPLPEPVAAAEPEPKEAPRFKLRPKAPAPQPAQELAPQPAQALAPPPAPFPEPSAEEAPVAPPAPLRPSQSLPPMSVLAAAPPPPLGSVAEAPAPPGSTPRLSLSTAQEKAAGTKGLPHSGSKGLPVSATRGLPVPGTDSLPKIGGKAVVVKPAKTTAVLRKRPALGPIAKVGLTVVVVAIAVGAFYSYRIFFPSEAPGLKLKLLPISKPLVLSDIKQTAAGALSKAAAAPGQLVEKGQGAIAAQRAQQQARVDAMASGGEQTPTPVPTASPVATEAVMGESSISSDVRVNNTPIVAAPAASPAFRAFVSNATIGGVFQGVPSRALINGTVVREGQLLDSSLGIAFERVDSDKKVIYFKDYTGAEVAKNY